MYMVNCQIRRHIGDANLAGKINGMLCCFGDDTDKLYIANPYQWSFLNSYFVMPKCIVFEYITPNI